MKERKKPNILILYSDQHSARALGCYGNNEVKTPNLDKLAAEGILMENAYCNNPICTPSRMCMLSGQYVHNFGYYGLMGKKPEHLPNLFGYMKKNGYLTGAVGKIHTPAGWISESCDYIADGYGFEVPVRKWNMHLEEGCQGVQGDEYSIYLAKKGLYPLRDDKILPEWFEKYEHRKGQCIDARPSLLQPEDTFEGWTVQKSKEFMEKAINNQTPFCLWMTMPRPHETYVAAKKFWNMYEGKKLSFPPNANNQLEDRDSAARDKQKSYQQEKAWIAYGGDFDEARQRVLRGYYACVSQVDDAVGQILQYVREMGIEEDTIILYMSDHGEFAGEHGMIEKAPGIGFHCVTRVPMIWRYKGGPCGARRESLVESVDVLPTLCSLAGLPKPNWVDGKDIVPILLEDRTQKNIAVTENPHTKTLHTVRYKFTQYLPEFHNGADFGELYDLKKDPWELHNLYFDKNYRKTVEELRYQLLQWLIRTTRVVTANPRIPLSGDIYDVSAGVSWDLAEKYGFSDEDGKVGENYMSRLIEQNQKFYL